MAKLKRGKQAKGKDGNRSRGKCPVCGRTGVRLMYEKKIKETLVWVCKPCRDREKR